MQAPGPTDLIGRIYDAAADENLWEGVLKAVADEVGGMGGVLVVTDLEKQEGRIIASVNVDLARQASYERYYGTIDPWTDAFKALPMGKVAVTDERMPQSELEKTEFYTDWLRPQGIARSMGAWVFRQGSRAIRLGIPRGIGQGSFAAADVDRFRTLVPHVQRALRLHARLCQVDLALEATGDVLDRLPFGVVLFDQQGRIVLLNRAMCEMCVAGDGLKVDKDRFGTARPADDEVLQRLLRTAADGEGRELGGSMEVARPSGRRPYQVLVTPLPPCQGMYTPVCPVAAVFVSDPEHRNGGPVALLQKVYRLSAKEAALAAHLAVGRSLDDVASQLGMAKDTARKHLQRINKKTGVTRQAELVAMLLSSPAGLFRTP